MHKKPMKLALCAGRHNIPQAEGAVFAGAVDPINPQKLENIAYFSLQNCCKLDLYVTGLTIALVAVINVCRELRIPVTLWHFNRDTNDYFPQELRM